MNLPYSKRSILVSHFPRLPCAVSAAAWVASAWHTKLGSMSTWALSPSPGVLDGPKLRESAGKNMVKTAWLAAILAREKWSMHVDDCPRMWVLSTKNEVKCQNVLKTMKKCRNPQQQIWEMSSKNWWKPGKPGNQSAGPGWWPWIWVIGKL